MIIWVKWKKYPSLNLDDAKKRRSSSRLRNRSGRSDKDETEDRSSKSRASISRKESISSIGKWSEILLMILFCFQCALFFYFPLQNHFFKVVGCLMFSDKSKTANRSFNILRLRGNARRCQIWPPFTGNRQYTRTIADKLFYDLKYQNWEVANCV